METGNVTTITSLLNQGAMNTVVLAINVVPFMVEDASMIGQNALAAVATASSSVVY